MHCDGFLGVIVSQSVPRETTDLGRHVGTEAVFQGSPEENCFPVGGKACQYRIDK